ncbi:MAG TPA: hypothetical protein DCQ00_08705 [Phascolarctobacterium succinatutens]|uniref:replication initiation protein n=1 Tax=Phascolarctobacterium succinatutens TaxID=626940 RepID=UPI000ED1A6BF|nr:replication initiation protein [Phascolarctobacterium succinatutens]HAM93564.1 hypothetical protein [Phascolarctobacterium succinatutens]
MTEQKIAKEKMLTIDKELKKTNPVYITVDRLVSKMKLSVLAEKIIRAIASNIAEGNCTNLEDLSLYTNIETSINTKTFCEIFNYKNDNCFTNLADAREELQYTGFTLPGKCRPTDSLIAKSYVKNGNMYFQISPLVLPYYVGKGIDYELINIINFKNVNTFKFYEFLLDKLKNENEAIFTLSFEETKEMFHVAKKYERYTDFKNNVLKPILKDINEENYNKENFCNIRLSIETIKNNRKITGIQFTITRKEPKIVPVISLNLIKEKLTDQGRVAYDFFQYTSNNGLFEIDNCIREYGEEKLIEIYEYVKYQYEHEKIKTTLKRYAANALKKGWCDPELINKQEKIKNNTIEAPNKPEQLETPKPKETYDERILNKITNMSKKQQQNLYEKILMNYPDKNNFAYQILSSLSDYEQLMTSPGYIKLYIRILKEQKFIDILMDQF